PPHRAHGHPPRARAIRGPKSPARPDRVEDTMAARAEASPYTRRAAMEFEYSKKTQMYQEQLADFMNKFVSPNEATFHQQLDSQGDRWMVPPIMEELKAKARERGL